MKRWMCLLGAQLLMAVPGFTAANCLSFDGVAAIPLELGDNLITVSGTKVLGKAGLDSIKVHRSFFHEGSSPIHYTAVNGLSIWPYDTPENAATNIQLAVDAAAAGDTVLVGDGIYCTGGAVAPGQACLNRICVIRPISIESVHGPEVTFIEGAPGSNGGCDTDAVRGGYIADGATLLGFTITNGFTMAAYGADGRGGGLYFETGGVAINCTLSGNTALDDGGGTFLGTLENCTLSGNTANWGGGASYGSLENCVLSGNTSHFDGGGSFWGTLKNCTLGDNTAVGKGGGASSGTLENCTLSSNTAEAGGGASFGTLENCTLSGNTADHGGGAYWGTLDNCTLIGNSANASGSGGGGVYYGTLNSCTLSGNTAFEGGGTFHGTLQNCIVWGNIATSAYKVAHDVYGSTATFCCASDGVTDKVNGCIIYDPLFDVDDYTLGGYSPCINKGNNGYVTQVTDRARNARIVYGVVDMGAYEYAGDFLGSVPDYDVDDISDVWEGRYFDYLTGCDPSADADSDTFNNKQEYIADTDPLDGSDWFHITTLAGSNVWFNSSANRQYTLLSCSNLVAGSWNQVPDQTDIPGTGGLSALIKLNDSTNAFYRVEVELEE